MSQIAAMVLDQLGGYPCTRLDGGWSLLVDTRPPGLMTAQAAQRLVDHGRVVATPMSGWGPSGQHYLRLVFATEPVARLTDLGAASTRPSAEP